MINQFWRIKARNSHLPVNFIGTATVTENLLKRKWSIVILRHLSNGLTHAADICKSEPELTPIALNERLRTMQRYGLIARHPRRASALIIAYQLTERGCKILRLLTLIEQLDELPTLNEIVLKRAPTEAKAADGRAPRPPLTIQNRPSKKREASLIL